MATKKSNIVTALVAFKGKAHQKIVIIYNKSNI